MLPFTLSGHVWIDEIKFAKIEAYGSFFLYRWSHVRKHGLKATVDYPFNRVCGTLKSDISAKLF